MKMDNSRNGSDTPKNPDFPIKVGKDNAGKTLSDMPGKKMPSTSKSVKKS